MTNVLYVPSLKKSLISVGAIADTGCVVLFSIDHCYVLDNKTERQIIASGYSDPMNGLYRLSSPHKANSIDNSGILWHKRYGHLSQIGLKHLVEHKRVTGIPNISFLTTVCEHCLAGKPHRVRFEHMDRQT